MSKLLNFCTLLEEQSGRIISNIATGKLTKSGVENTNKTETGKRE